MTRSSLWQVAAETLRDALPMLPLLFVLYTALELLSHREGSRLLTRGRLPRAFGSVAGALLGVIPQCGMSVFMTSLFLGGRVTAGTLVATYLATSDEAIPVLLADGHRYDTIFVLVGIKCAVGIVSGWTVDALLPRWFQPDPAAGYRTRIQLHVEREMHEAAWSEAAAHGLRRAVEIVAWVFVVSLLLAIAVRQSGFASLTTAARAHPILEIVGAAIVGLIPNCSASVAIAEAYMRGVLSFGATVAGLCAGAGYGPILMLRRGLFRTAVKLLGVCLGFSLAAGAIVRATGVGP